jgi:hypothetical protein
MGFKWKKTKNDRTVLLESRDMGEMRLERRQSRKDCKNNMDELYILFSHVKKKSWSGGSRLVQAETKFVQHLLL